jgi:hypothetical protein
LLVDGAVTRLLDAVVKGTDLSDDAKLLELGQQFEELWRHERRVEDALKSGNLSLDEQEQDSLL